MRRVAFVVSEFPRPVDAYMLRELQELVSRGVDLRIYSLRRPGHRATPRSATALVDRTVYAPGAGRPALWSAHARFLGRAPGDYAAALADTTRGHLPSPRLLAKVLAVWPQTVWFAARALEDGIEHIHANWATYPAAAAATIARLVGRPWSFAGHASDIHLDVTNLAAKIRAAAFVTTCTEDARRYLARVADGNAEHVHTVYHGLDLAAPTAPRVPPGALELLAVGTLRDCKGFDTLLSVTARLRAEGLPAQLTIVGDGEERPALEALARALGLGESVRFTGYVPHEELARTYASASVLVHPARSANHFGIPNVILEAQAAGLPVVCTPLPAIAELLEDGVSGVYVREDDPDELVATLRALHADPERCARMAEEGIRRVRERFDIRHTATAFARLLMDAPAEAPAREAVA